MHSTAQASGSAASDFAAASLRRGEAKNRPKPFSAREKAVAHGLVNGGGRNRRFRRITIERAIDFLLTRFQIRRELHRARMWKTAGAAQRKKAITLVAYIGIYVTI